MRWALIMSTIAWAVSVFEPSSALMSARGLGLAGQIYKGMQSS